MTQKDISDLEISEVDWDAGRITRKRSKTRRFENVPTVGYLLWPKTRRLLCEERNPGKTGKALLNKLGGPLIFQELSPAGKLKKNDNIKSAFHRLQQKTKIRKPLKSLKKTSATLLRNDRAYASLEDLFLGHAPQKMSDKHYAQLPQTLLDEAIIWLGQELEICQDDTDNSIIDNRH